MKKGLFSFFIILTILSLAACGGSSGDDDKVTLDPILDEAVDLGDFPEDAEVVEMEDLTVNGTDVTGTDSVELDDTTESEIDVSVTLPPSLSRSLNLAGGLNIWTNGRSSKVLYNSETRKADLGLPLEMGPNYFTFHFDTTSGKRYRSVVVKITRIGVALKIELKYATENFASLSTVQSVKVDVNADGYTKTFIRKTSNRNIDIGVPSLNKNLAIAITAYTSTDDTSFVLEYSGAKTVASVTGTSVDVPVSMVMSKSKLVVPDSDSDNNRILVYRSMDDETPITLFDSEDESSLKVYVPNDVDFDNAGRLYVSFGDSQGVPKVLCYSDLVNSPRGIESEYGDLVSLAVDRDLNRVYIVSSDSLYIYDIGDGSVVGQIDLGSSGLSLVDGQQSITSIETSGNGRIYLAVVDLETPVYSKILTRTIDTTNNTLSSVSGVTDMTSGLDEGSQMDLFYKDGALYASLYFNQKIIKYSGTLVSQDEFDFSNTDLPDCLPMRFIGRGWDGLCFSDANSLIYIDSLDDTTPVIKEFPSTE